MKQQLLLFAILLCALPLLAVADDKVTIKTSKPTSQPGDEERRDYLPGEEVKTKTGQKLKVWSTRGPVPVSPAPEPFDKKNEIDNLEVIVDDRGNTAVQKKH